MNSTQFFIYLFLISGSTYLIRAIPFNLIKKKITNQYINSFLHYIPYTVLAAMTIPSAFFVTGNIYTALVGLLVALVLALKKCSLTVVALLSCVAVFLAEILIRLI